MRVLREKRAPGGSLPILRRPRVARAQKIIRPPSPPLFCEHKANADLPLVFLSCLVSHTLVQRIPLPIFALPLSRESPGCPSLRASDEHILTYGARSASKKDGLVAPYPRNLAS
jgi:hypothetical protein